jgi:hypothetical protein
MRDGIVIRRPAPVASRRQAILGLAAIAAPFVGRTPGLLMPIRNRIVPVNDILNSLWFRGLNAYPPAPAEVKAWRQSVNATFRMGIRPYHSPAGMIRILKICDAEKRFEALGLL